MIILKVFLLVLAFAFVGRAFSYFVRSIFDDLSIETRFILYAAIGALGLGVVLHILQVYLIFIPHFVVIGSAVVPFGIGLWLSRDETGEVRRLRPLVIWIVGLTIVVGTPFVFHLAPPDVDSMAFTYFAFLMKSGLGFPVSQPWLAGFSEKAILASDANSNMTVLVSLVTASDLALSALTMACVWVVLTLLMGLALIRRLLTGAPTFLAAVALLFVFNRAFIWEYGDSSYARVPATLAMFVVFFLCVNEKIRRTRLTWAMVGFVHGILLYYHYRLFIWHTVILGVWLIDGWIRDRGPRRWHRIVAPFVSALVVAPLIIALLSRYSNTAIHKTSPLFSAKHAMSNEVLWGFVVRFQGYVMLVICLVGAALVILYRPIKSRANEAAFRFGTIHFLVMVFFCFDPLVLWVAPWSFNYLYSQMAILSNFSIPKLIMGTAVLSALANKIELTLVMTVGLLVASSYLLWREIELRLPKFKFQFTNHGTELWYSFLCLLGALILLAAFSRLRRSALVAAAFGLAIGSNEFVEARFNYPYLAPGDREVFEWLRKNTDFKTTLVLNYSAIDLDEKLEIKNLEGVLPKGNYRSDYRTHWLPVISERASVFHRVNIVNRFAVGNFQTLGGSEPEFEQLDYAYWRLNESQSCEVIRRNRITHVYTTSFTRKATHADQSPCLKLEYESEDRRSNLLDSDVLELQRPAVFSVTNFNRD